MEICWDNLEKLRYSKKTGKFYVNNKIIYYYKTNCFNCGESFLGQKNNIFCSNECSNSGKQNPMYGKKSPNYKGGVTAKNIPLYDTYAPQLEPYEQCRRNIDNPNILEIKCTYCGKWYIPQLYSTTNRIRGINSNDILRFYCSMECKQVCPLYHQTSDNLIKQDMIRSGFILPEELVREVQPELRQMSFARDDYICVKCGSNGPLHCHHIDPVANNPIESADVDNCITLCVDCHKEAHRLPGCGYNELKNCKGVEYERKF